MVTVAVVAGLLAVLRLPDGVELAFGALNLIPAAMLWQAFRRFRRLAALGFGVVATLANIACAILCIYWQGMAGIILGFLAWFLAFPFILGIGTAWATAATRREAIFRRSLLAVWLLVIVLAFLPLTMLITQWPFRLAFLASKPALSRLADQVANGQGVPRPLRAGVFVVVGSIVDPSTGSVGLITDPDPGGRCGFVRVGPSGSLGRTFVNLNHDLQLGDGWSYECED